MAPLANALQSIIVEALVKWFELSGRDNPPDIYLLHDPGTGAVDRVRLPRFASLRRCSGCGKWDEDEILAIGFDPDRHLAISCDMTARVNDIS
jgi:hypothetical protein